MHKNGYVHLCDFGIAKVVQIGKEKAYNKKIDGTPEYIAPEVLLGEPHSFASDWWALGVLM